jgi:acyl-CoA thioesterase-2
MPRSSDELLALLDIEDIDTNLFRGRQPDTELQRVFGGQVAAQALIAAARTTADDFHVHSLHSYFLRPGDTTVPIIYDVENLRDGRSFATRRVVARQHGRPIYLQSVNFQVVEDGFEHQDTMPDVKGPDGGISLAELFGDRGRGSGAWEKEWAALDVRYLGNSAVGGVAEDASRPARAQLWSRLSGRISDDPLDHVAAFTYASDMTLIGAALVPHGKTVGSPGMQVASLDHTIWFHRPFRADEWLLYDQTSPSASGARGLALGRVFTQDGRLVATVAQEGLIRPVR